MERENTKAHIDSLQAYSTLAHLGHSDKRLAELYSSIARVFDALNSLRQISISEVELAVTFAVSVEPGP